jgi:hypothetical protein
MFVSFFPRPLVFAVSAILWGALAIGLWYTFGPQLGTLLGFHFQAPAEKLVGVSVFWSDQFLWFYLYFAISVALFASAWMLLSPHPWSLWSIAGSALILFTSYFQVQVSVAINSWYGPFYDLIQAALSKSAPVTLSEFYLQLATFAGIAFVAVSVGVLTRFFVSHYIFRWRTAMNDYYAAHWPHLRTVEGASQRVQEDAMRFATSMEGLGVNLVSAVMTLIAFLPVLVRLSGNVTELSGRRVIKHFENLVQLFPHCRRARGGRVNRHAAGGLMTEEHVGHNPAALADQLVQQAAADAAAAGTTIQTAVAALKADASTGTNATSGALKSAQTTLKADAAVATADVDAAATAASGAAKTAVAHLDAALGFISTELAEAKTKLLAAVAWIEAHFTTRKATS